MGIVTKFNPLGALPLSAGKRRYTLTVVTTPSDAVCKITANGSTITAKSLTADAGTYVNVEVSYSSTTTKTYTLTLNQNTTLTFNRTYTTSTSFNNNLTKVGSPSLNTSSGIASGFSYNDYFTCPNTITSSYNGTNFEISTKITTSSTVKSETIMYCRDSSGSYGFSLTINSSSKLTIYSAAGNGNIISVSSTAALSANTTYYVKASNTTATTNKLTVAYSTNNSSWITKEGTANPIKYTSGGITCCIGTNRLATNTTSKVPFKGSIDVMNTEIKLNGYTFWSGKRTTYNYYFTVGIS